MTPQDLRKLLIDRNMSEASIARSVGLTKQAVNNVFRWRSRSPWLRRAIAKALDIPYRVAWGEEDPGTDCLPRGRRQLPAPVDSSINTSTSRPASRKAS